MEGQVFFQPGEIEGHFVEHIHRVGGTAGSRIPEF